MPRTKRTEDVKWRILGMRDAGMKQVDIARALNVSQTVVKRLLKKHRLVVFKKVNDARYCY